MRSVLLFSGGMDSTALLWHLREAKRQVFALSVDYGQRHRKELDAAREICSRAGVEQKIADLSAVSSFLSGSALTSSDIAVPEGHYTDESMKATVVPNRNMVMLSIAAAWAIGMKADSICYAAHSGDHTIYPDCRPEFVAALGKAVSLADWHTVSLETPFLTLTKAQICARGAELKAPLEKSWSCYRGGSVHCGKCGTCVERKEAFTNSGVQDPTLYAE